MVGRTWDIPAPAQLSCCISSARPSGSCGRTHGSLAALQCDLSSLPFPPLTMETPWVGHRGQPNTLVIPPTPELGGSPGDFQAFSSSTKGKEKL